MPTGARRVIALLPVGNAASPVEMPAYKEKSPDHKGWMRAGIPHGRCGITPCGMNDI